MQMGLPEIIGDLKGNTLNPGGFGVMSSNFSTMR